MIPVHSVRISKDNSSDWEMVLHKAACIPIMLVMARDTYNFS